MATRKLTDKQKDKLKDSKFVRSNSVDVTVNSSFEDDIEEVDFDNLPLLDKASSQKVGDRVVGQIASLVSQFTVSDEYSLINYNSNIVRVTPLEHNGIFKYFANLSGTAGYVIVDCTTGSAKLVETDEGLKYLPSAYIAIQQQGSGVLGSNAVVLLVTISIPLYISISYTTLRE